MNTLYQVSKSEFFTKEIEEIYVFFKNGDYISLKENEIVEMSTELGDNLQFYNNRICFNVVSGFLKCEIKPLNQIKYDYFRVYNSKDYKVDRKTYIENRCANIKDIECITIHNINNWHFTIVSNISAKVENGYLVFEFAYNDTCDKDFASINIKPIKKQDVMKMNLSFENCESYDIFQSEILEMQINLKPQLEWIAGDLGRVIQSGYMHLKLDKYNNARLVVLFSDKETNKKYLLKRLCSKKQIMEHDICWLHIDYYGIIFNPLQNESLDNPDIRSDEVLEAIEKEEDETGIADYSFYGGYTKLLKDGSILITFGKNSKEKIEKLIEKLNRKSKK